MQTTIVNDLIHQSLSDLVLTLPSARQVFIKYDLDYCCGGKLSLEKACSEKGLKVEDILAEIENTVPTADNLPLHVQDWSTGFLIDFIIENYHRYVRNSVPVINDLLEKVCSVHANQNPYLLTIQSEFGALADELLNHMQKEELILFPALREREETKGLSTNPVVNMIQQPIAAMEHEHQEAGDLLKSIRSLSRNYTSPADACPTFILTYQKLAEFDRELINHIHLENNVLFKRA